MKPEDRITELQGRMSEMVLAQLSRRVRTFMALFGHYQQASPAVPQQDVVRLRLRLVAEEFFELLRATVSNESAIQLAETSVEIAIDSEQRVDMISVADALGDIDYVVEGMRAAFGINGQPVADAIHASNMAKVGGKTDENGKLQKPVNWVPPNIRAVLIAQGWVPPRVNEE